MPRYGKQFKSFTGIIPSLELDITELCDGAFNYCELNIELIHTYNYVCSYQLPVYQQMLTVICMILHGS